MQQSNYRTGDGLNQEWKLVRGKSRGKDLRNSSNRNFVDTKVQESWKNIQRSLQATLIYNDDFDVENVTLVGGLDISFFKKEKNRAIVCLSVFTYPGLKHVKNVVHDVNLTAPYVPGFLAFREVDHYIKVVEELKRDDPNLIPDLILVDGNGILHYRGLGSASHFGVLSGIPTIGVAKKLLCVDGLRTEEVDQRALRICHQPGDYFFLEGLRYGRLGACMLSADGELPIYISIGHRISLETCIRIVAQCLEKGQREPTPTLHADRVGRERVRKEVQKQRAKRQRTGYGNRYRTRYQ